MSVNDPILPPDLDTIVEAMPLIPTPPRSPDSRPEFPGERNPWALLREQLEALPVLLSAVESMHADVKRALAAAEKAEHSASVAKDAAQKVFDDHFKRAKRIDDFLESTERRLKRAEADIQELRLDA